MWLLDTVALAEAAKPRANPGFLTWLDHTETETLFTSVLCLGEIRRGVEMLPPGARRAELQRWLERDLTAWWGPRALAVEASAAQAWGRLGARGRHGPIDALIGACALDASLTVVTRNARDFDGLGVPVLNPWT